MGTTMDIPMGQKGEQKKIPGIVEVYPEELEKIKKKK